MKFLDFQENYIKVIVSERKSCLHLFSTSMYVEKNFAKFCFTFSLQIRGPCK